MPSDMSDPTTQKDLPKGGSALVTLDEGVRIAIAAIRANKVRASLTILGVAIGVAVVVTMAALITGIRSSVMEAFDAVGQENFIVTRFSSGESRFGARQCSGPCSVS